MAHLHILDLQHVLIVLQCFCYVCDVRASDCKFWGGESGSNAFQQMCNPVESYLWLYFLAFVAAAATAAVVGCGTREQQLHPSYNHFLVSTALLTSRTAAFQQS